jgi:hypothetical protein
MPDVGVPRHSKDALQNGIFLEDSRGARLAFAYSLESPPMARLSSWNAGARGMNRFVRIDRRYNNPYRFTSYAQRALLKWGALLVVWVILISSNPWLAALATGARP